MTTTFFLVFVLLILAELVKGLSANGTPPILQKLSWQMGLARFMWSNIVAIRVVLVALLVFLFFNVPDTARLWVALGAVPFAMAWWGVYWVFNRYWVGKFKFLPIQQKTFVNSDANEVDLNIQVLGIDYGGQQKAYPVSMVMYHHQIADEIAGKAIWPTYCGLCRSGRIYDREVNGDALDFELVGAITFNAVFADKRTGSWWRQETGVAANGPMKGRQLDDLPFEQMTLENWLAQHPESTVLQYDPAFRKKYGFANKMLNYEASAPSWHMQTVPPLILGVDLDGVSKAWDWDRFTAARVISDDVAGRPLVLISAEDESSGFVYERSLDGEILEFDLQDGALKDRQTGSTWDQFGSCIAGSHKGSSLTKVQSYKQNVRSWISFHPDTAFFEF